MVDYKILEDIGLSKGEAIVYIALTKLGKTKSGNIIKSTGLQSSVVHNSLNALINKGFISYILEGQIKQYIPLKPKLIEDYIDAKKNEFKRIVPELESLQKLNSKPTIAEVYEGYKGIYAATLLMIKDTKPNDTFKYFAVEKNVNTEESLDFFNKTDLLKKEKELIVKGIANKAQKEWLKKYTQSEIKYVDQKIPSVMNICKDKVLLISFSDKPTGILIQSEEIAKQYHELWDSIWKIAKK